MNTAELDQVAAQCRMPNAATQSQIPALRAVELALPSGAYCTTLTLHYIPKPSGNWFVWFDQGAACFDWYELGGHSEAQAHFNLSAHFAQRTGARTVNTVIYDVPRE